jgi:hypothetical protein
MNVKQKLKRKRKKAWKQKLNRTDILARKLKFHLLDRGQVVPGSKSPYYNSFTGKMSTIYCLLNDKSQIIMEDRLPEIEDYLDRLWKLKVFF